MKYKISHILSVVIIGYITKQILRFSRLYYPSLHVPIFAPKVKVTNPEWRLDAQYKHGEEMRLLIYMDRENFNSHNDKAILLLNQTYILGSTERIDLQLNVSVGGQVPQYAHVFLLKGSRISSDVDISYAKTVLLADMQVIQDDTRSLLGGDNKENSQENVETIILPHFKSRLVIRIMDDDRTYYYQILSSMNDFHPHLTISKEKKYLPIIYLQDDAIERSQYIPISNSNMVQKELDIKISRISLGTFRVNQYLHHGFKNLEKTMDEKELDALRYTFFVIDSRFLFLTMAAAALHLLFEGFAIKNDVEHWRATETLDGVASSSVYMKAFSSVLGWIYMFDHKSETSAVVIWGGFAATLVEIWKAIKVWKMDKSREMFKADRYVLLSVIPVTLSYAIYSILFRKFTGYKSYSIEMGMFMVYFIEFIQLTPQLFLNYKMKSTAAMPIRTFLFRAINTFVDDLMAFTIKMPTLTRMSVFRDDIVFFVLLYQMWLYRHNERRKEEIKTE